MQLGPTKETEKLSTSSQKNTTSPCTKFISAFYNVFSFVRILDWAETKELPVKDKTFDLAKGYLHVQVQCSSLATILLIHI